MISIQDIHQLAARIQSAQDDVRQLPPLTSERSDFDLPSAYAVAEQVMQARRRTGALTVGRKIGFTNAALWEVYAVRQPIWGWMYEHSVAHLAAQAGADTGANTGANTGTGVGTCSIGRFTEPKIEPEIVLHFHRAPPAGADEAGVLACIDWVAHGFEIVQSHFAGWRFQVADTVADGGLHGCLVVGPAVPVAALGDDPIKALASFSLSLQCDGAERDHGSGANVLGSPLAAVRHLIQVLAGQPGAQAIQAGELITTGTVTLAHAIRAGECWTTELQGIALPGLQLRFTD